MKDRYKICIQLLKNNYKLYKTQSNTLWKICTSKCMDDQVAKLIFGIVRLSLIQYYFRQSMSQIVIQSQFSNTQLQNQVILNPLEILFNQYLDQRKLTTFNNIELNIQQQQALQSCLSQKLTIISGPSYTGKKLILLSFIQNHFNNQNTPLLIIDDNKLVLKQLQELINLQLPQYKSVNITELSFTKKNFTQVKKEVLDNRIILSTCLASDNDLMRDLKFPVIVINNAQMPSQFKTLIPICKGFQQLILFGDLNVEQYSNQIVGDGNLGDFQLPSSILHRLYHNGAQILNLCQTYRLQSIDNKYQNYLKQYFNNYNSEKSALQQVKDNYKDIQVLNKIQLDQQDITYINLKHAFGMNKVGILTRQEQKEYLRNSLNSQVNFYVESNPYKLCGLNLDFVFVDSSLAFTGNYGRDMGVAYILITQVSQEIIIYGEIEKIQTRSVVFAQLIQLILQDQNQINQNNQFNEKI